MQSSATGPQARLKPTMKMDRPPRPLKTYGKRSFATETEPLAKKRKISEKDDEEDGCIVAASSFDLPQPSSPELPPALPPQSARRGTITSYFKVVPSSASNPDSSSSSSCAERPSTPPTSPRANFTRRKARRRLTTRHVSYDSETQPEDVDSHSHQSSCRGVLNTDKTKALNSSTDSSLNKKSKSSSKIIPQKKSDDSAQNNTSSPVNKTKTPGGAAAATVQTTLSLSMTDSGFTECRTCGMLYNPLHAKDVALHARTHAAAVRRKRPLLNQPAKDDE